MPKLVLLRLYSGWSLCEPQHEQVADTHGPIYQLLSQTLAGDLDVYLPPDNPSELESYWHFALEKRIFLYGHL